MKGKNMTYTLLLGVAITFGHSCVRDKVQPCPPLQVNIEVKDKNYSNVDKVALEEKLPEDLAFCKYIPTLYYMLRNAATGKVVEEQGVFKVDGDKKKLFHRLLRHSSSRQVYSHSMGRIERPDLPIGQSYSPDIPPQPH